MFFFLILELKQFLLIGRSTDIRIMSLDADQNVDLILPIKGISGANGIDYDILQKKVFWADTKNKTITCAFLNGTGNYSLLKFYLLYMQQNRFLMGERNTYFLY